MSLLRGEYVFLIDVGLKRNPFVNKFVHNESMTRWFWPRRNKVERDLEPFFPGRTSAFFNSFPIDGNWIREIQTISKKAKCRTGSHRMWHHQSCSMLCTFELGLNRWPEFGPLSQHRLCLHFCQLKIPFYFCSNLMKSVLTFPNVFMNK